MPEALQCLLARRSVRQYEPRPVERAKIEVLLRAAQAAPTAANSEPWEFVVLTEPERLDELRAKLLFARYNAPAAIVVLGNTEIANNSAARHYWVQDCSAATQNILIAAEALGLGAVWIGVYPLPSAIEPVRQVLGLPEHVTPLSVVLLGYPAEKPPPRGRYDEHRIYWQQYEARKPRAKKKDAKHT
jgi:nitroreductase